MRELLRTFLAALTIVLIALSIVLLSLTIPRQIERATLPSRNEATYTATIPIEVIARPTSTRKPRMCLVDSTGSFGDIWVFDVNREQIVSIPSGVGVIVGKSNSEDALFTYLGREFMTPRKNLKPC